MRKQLDYKRADRVGELIKHEMSEILLREAKDPRIESVTITRVQLTDDLRSARIYFGVLDRTAQIDEVEEGLEKASSFIHSLLVKRLRLKFIPRMTFHFDRNLDYSFHISRILDDLDVEED